MGWDRKYSSVQVSSLSWERADLNEAVGSISTELGGDIERDALREGEREPERERERDLIDEE